MKEAVFSLRGYKFPMVKMDLLKIKPLQNKLNLSILPKGVFYPKNHSFELSFKFVFEVLLKFQSSNANLHF